MSEILKNEGAEYGKLFGPKTLMMTQAVGEATEGEEKYDLLTNLGGGLPIIFNKRTRRYFGLKWEDVLELARKAGIDDEGEGVEVTAVPSTKNQGGDGK